MSFLKNWNLIRFLRLALGITILIQGIQAQEWSFIILGIVFSSLPILNFGCCSTTNCFFPTKENDKKPEDITYEEIH